MSRGYEASTFVAVEFSLKEFKDWLKANKPSKKLDKLLSSGTDYEIVEEYIHTSSGSKGKFFCSLDFEDETFGTIYYGYKLSEVYLGAYDEGSDSAEVNFSVVEKKAKKLQEDYPNKKIKIVTYNNDC